MRKQFNWQFNLIENNTENVVEHDENRIKAMKEFLLANKYYTPQS